jgi:hypothetical protein
MSRKDCPKEAGPSNLPKTGARNRDPSYSQDEAWLESTHWEYSVLWNGKEHEGNLLLWHKHKGISENWRCIS